MPADSDQLKISTMRFAAVIGRSVRAEVANRHSAGIRVGLSLGYEPFTVSAGAEMNKQAQRAQLK